MRSKRTALLVLILIFFISGGAYAKQGNEVPILMYHNIEAEPAEGYNTMTVSPARFLDDMRFLRDNGFTPLLASELAEIIDGTRDMPSRPVFISFDDGYQSNFIHAYPILKQTGMKANIALLVESIKHDGHYPSWTLYWWQCKEMVESGIIELGSHSFNLHNPTQGSNYVPNGVNGIQRLPGETKQEFDERVGSDLEKSISTIERNTGQKVTYFAYPFGAQDEWFTEHLEKNNIKFALDVTTELADLDLPFSLGRIRVDMDRPLREEPLLQKYLEVKADVTMKAENIRIGDKLVSLSAAEYCGEDYVSLEQMGVALSATNAGFGIIELSGSGRLALDASFEQRKVNGAIPVGITAMEPVNLAISHRDGTLHIGALKSAAGAYYIKTDDISQICAFIISPEYDEMVNAKGNTVKYRTLSLLTDMPEETDPTSEGEVNLTE